MSHHRHEPGTNAFVGVDGGGTRATALVTDAAGRPLARVTGKPGIVHSTDPTARAADLSSLVREALERANRTVPADALFCGLAGAARPVESAALESVLRSAGISRAVRVGGDAEPAMEDAFGSGPGILLIAGTGSIAWGRGEDARLERVGGWGRVFGDEGSGYALGIAALRAVSRAHDGRGPATALTASVLEHTGVGGPPALIAWADRASKGEIAALAALACAEADGMGDAVAATLLAETVHALARHVSALSSRLAPWTGAIPLALSGGLLSSDSPIRALLAAELQAAGLDVRFRRDEVDAARGAAALARRLERETPAG